MQLKLFKTLWGIKGDLPDAVLDARQSGYDGIEGPIPNDTADEELLAGLLAENNLAYIAEIATAGGYVPDRRLSVRDHLHDLRAGLKRLKHLQPLFITCLGGCDAWTREESLGFLGRAIEIAGEYGHTICFETHRGRSLYTPWMTRAIVEQLPEIRLTLDISHWYVVCEGLQATEEAIIDSLVKNAGHIHGRVGYDQGPQVPDPGSPLYARELQRHLGWWRSVWEQHAREGRACTTVTPEFGPDGYDYRDPVTGLSLIDPDMLNDWMASRLREEFEEKRND